MEWRLLSSLDDDQRAAVLALTHPRDYAQGEVLVHEGDPAESLHLVESGRLTVRVSTVEGDSATLNILGPGDYFGELSLMDRNNPVRTATIVALEPTRTRQLSASAFRDLRASHRAVEQLLLVLLAHRVDELSARLLEVMYDDLERRVARRLSHLTDLYATTSTGPVVISLTQEHLAELVGGTRPSINQALQGLAQRGIVSLGRGRLTILDRERLAREAG